MTTFATRFKIKKPFYLIKTSFSQRMISNIAYYHIPLNIHHTTYFKHTIYHKHTTHFNQKFICYYLFTIETLQKNLKL